MCCTSQRRHHASRIRESRRRLHLATYYDPDHSDCWCTKEPGFFYSTHPFSCACHKRRKGRPKVAGGMCGVGARTRIYKWRRQAKDLDLAVRTGTYGLDSDELTLLESPGAIRNWY